MGLDSLMALEVRNALQKSLGHGRTLPSTLVIEYPTIARLSRYLAELLFDDASESTAAPSGEDLFLSLDNIERLSDAEVQALLAGYSLPTEPAKGQSADVLSADDQEDA